MFEYRPVEMLPEPVNQRLSRLAGICNGNALALKRHGNIKEEFLAATQMRCFSSCPTSSNDALHPDSRRGMSSTIQFTPYLARKYPDLPLDILIEMAAYAYPLDLINLSQTSKQLRRLFMSKNSRTTWRIVLGNVPELPPCPGDMCEPLYVALVFGHHCFGCGAENAFWVDYALRLRMCELCYKANVIEGTEVLKSLPEDFCHKIRDVLLMLVPSANNFNFANLYASFDRINPLYHLSEDFYFKPEIEAMLRLFWPVPVSQDIAQIMELMRIRANYIIMRQMHAVLIHAWDNYCAEPVSGSNFFRIKKFYEEVEYTQVIHSDWDEVCAPENPVFAGYLKGTGPKQSEASRLLRDPPKSQTQLTAEHRALKQCDDIARAARIRARFAQAARWHEGIVRLHPSLDDEDLAQLPNAHDTEKLWEPIVLRGGNDARGPLDPALILNEDFLGPFVVDRLLAYGQRAMRSLAGALERFARRRTSEAGRLRARRRKGAHRKELSGGTARAEPWADDWMWDPEEVLRRPTALFVCMECGAHPYAYPEINVHWQGEHPEKSVWADSASEAERAGEYRAEVWEEGVEVAEKILAVLIERGLPKGERDMGQLDGLIEDGRVFCACGDPTMASPDSEDGLSWETLVDHVFNHLNNNTLRSKTCLRSSNDAGEVAPIWLNDHDLASCISYLPEDADTSHAGRRVTADQSTRERIDSLLSQCPEMASPACRLCDALTPDHKKDGSLFLMKSADAIFYHMQAKHGKQVDEKDIVFWEDSIFDKL